MNSKGNIGRSHRSPLVGRASEVEMLRQLLFVPQRGTNARIQRTASSIPLDTLRKPHCMVLMGEAGIGKTRLAEETSREAQERGWSVSWSRSYAQESTFPYRLWIEILRGLINHDPWQKQELYKRPLLLTRLAALLPELNMSLPDAAPQVRQSPEQEQQGLWEAILDLFKLSIEHTPLLVVLDDLQWADSSSCELLAYLVRRLSGFPIVFLGTCREIELDSKHPLRVLVAHMQREHTITTLHVQPLNDIAINTLIASLQLPEHVAQDIREQAAGNPFFAEELAYSYTVTSPSLPAYSAQAIGKKSSSLPSSIAAALDQRMSKLSHDCQKLLGNAAVLGGSFEFSLICSMEISNSTTDEDTVLDLLDEALQSGVLTEEGRGARVNYHFWQPLLVSHLYDSLSATRRALLHRRAADILRQSYANHEAEGAATITHHLVQGGAEPQHIVRYATVAGDRAYALSAYPEAERYYRIASENVKAVLTSAQYTSHNLENHAHLAYLLEQLGECIRIQGNYEEARRVYEQLLRERSAHQDDAFASEAEQEAQIDALLLSEIGWTWYYAADYESTRQYCEQGEQVLHQADVKGGPAWARLYFLQSYMLWQEGKYDEAHHAANRALHLFEEILPIQRHQHGSVAPLTRMRRTLEGDPVDVARTHRLLGALASSVGQLTEALTHLNTALNILEEHDHKREVAHVSCNVGYVHLQKAEHQEARLFLQRARALAEQIGDIPLTAVIYSNLGVLAERTGYPSEAENWLKRSLSLVEQTNDQVYLSTWHVELAVAYQDEGRLSDARTCIGRALTIGRSMHNAPCIGLALVSLGNLRIAQALEAQIEQKNHSNRTKATNERDAFQAYLARASKTLQRALTFERLEAEARNRGQLASAQVSLLQGDTETAYVQALHALKKAQQYELTWLIAHAYHLLGAILSTQGQHAEAFQYFEQAIQLFRARDMRLETARTLQSYALALLQSDNGAAASHQQALHYLQEALRIVRACHAALEQKSIEHSIAGLTFSHGA